MKKIITLLFACIAFATTYAQQTQTAPKPPQMNREEAKQFIKNMPAANACPKCFTITKENGACAKCNVSKVQLGSYYCYKCNKGTGIRPGNCASCNTATTQITRRYCAEHNGTPMRADFRREHKNDEHAPRPANMQPQQATEQHN